MQDHHCLYQVGWAVAEWCDGCGMDWSWFRQTKCPGLSELDARQAYEVLIEDLCDEVLPCRRHDERDETEQLVMPWSDPASPADREEERSGWGLAEAQWASPN